MPISRSLLLAALLFAGTAAQAAVDCGDLSESQCNDLQATARRNDNLAAEARSRKLREEAEVLARCVIDRMPKAMSDTAAAATYEFCLPGHTLNYAEAPPRSQSISDYIFGYGSGAACAAKEGAATPSQQAKRQIKAACEYLYGK